MSNLFPLSVEGALTRRRGRVLVGPVDLKLDPTGTTMVIGPNGAGKTSLLRMLHGIARLGAGRINWACEEHEAQRHQAFVFQQPVMMRRTVQDNLAYPLRLSGVKRAEARDRAAVWAGKVGLGAMLTRQATVLSGGERQKLAIARALIRDPELLFLDEPCSSLDGRATREIEEILHGVAEVGTRIIMSTHDMGQARRLGTEVAFLLHGKVHEFAAADTFFPAPATAQARAFLNGDIVE
ncbi:ATP-binding cassette domain-containing protein [Aliiroseovarius sp.]|uniref:ATP-binding cassette domain-containing protein n=1 Tax=Aliiroseovarius sp. TaxID=1872442 RepID=UPI00262CA56A|nr:ATP-binding cassette domain-containing protein [Aliiroseovarius sp.]